MRWWWKVLTAVLAIVCWWIAQGALGARAQSDDRIVFTSDLDGNLEIYVMEADGSNVQRLTYDPAQDIHPVWSPDRQQIAFVSNRGGGNFAVYIMSTDGSNVRRVTPDDGNYYDMPAWSPDGRWLALVTDRTGNIDIYLLDVSTLELRAITQDAAEDLDPGWSSDGSRIVFASYRGRYAALYQADVSGQQVRELLSDPEAELREPAWSPDGQQLAYIRTETGPNGIFSDVMIADTIGGAERQLVGVDNMFLKSPGWSPDGQSIVYERAPLEGPSTIQRVNLQGQSASQLTRGDSHASSPHWFSPLNTMAAAAPASNPVAPTGRVVFVRDLELYLQDGGAQRRIVATGETYEPDLWGKWAVYASARHDRRLDIYLFDLETNAEYQLTTHDAQDRHPSFSPDGQRIAFTSNRTGDWDIFLMNVDGSGLQQITYSTAYEYAPTWSADGRQIAYQSNAVGGEEIFIHDLTTGTARQLTDAVEPLVGALWSPGGDYIAGYANAEPYHVFVADATSGSIFAWTPGIANEWLDARTLLFHRRDGNVSNVYTLDVHSGVETLLIENGSWSASG